MNYKALREGREAYRQGQKLADNPYRREHDRKIWARAFASERDAKPCREAEDASHSPHQGTDFNQEKNNG